MKNPTWQTEIVGLWETLKYEPFVILLFPMFWSSNWFYTYQQNYVNAARFDTRTRPLNGLLYYMAHLDGSLGPCPPPVEYAMGAPCPEGLPYDPITGQCSFHGPDHSWRYIIAALGIARSGTFPSGTSTKEVRELLRRTVPSSFRLSRPNGLLSAFLRWQLGPCPGFHLLYLIR